MCCGVPLVSKNRESFESAAERRALEAKAAGAQTIVVNCAGCFSLSSKAKKHGLEVYHLIEMVQRALGESPPHRIEEIKNGLIQSIFEKIADDPKSLEQRYVIEDGTIRVV